MKTIYSSSKESLFGDRFTLRTVLFGAALVSLLSYVTLEQVNALYYEPLTAQMDQGDKNMNVTRLQTFISANPSIYPSGLVTGYFGTLTAKAVIAFQNQNGLEPVGRVGPATLTKLNTLIANGGWTAGNTTVDGTSPSFYNVTTAVGTNYLTFSFNTNEVTMARVVYSTSPLMFNEGDINSNGFGPIGGYGVSSTAGLSASHSITLPNLAAGMSYYYTIIATDVAGNASVWGPNNRLSTSN